MGWGGGARENFSFYKGQKFLREVIIAIPVEKIEKSGKSNFTPRLGVSSREISDVTTRRNAECEMALPLALLPSSPTQGFVLVHLFLVSGEGLGMACVVASFPRGSASLSKPTGP